MNIDRKLYARVLGVNYLAEWANILQQIVLSTIIGNIFPHFDLAELGHALQR